jgi:Type III flagellar switch regulator (C-ring) FliN C-term
MPDESSSVPSSGNATEAVADSALLLLSVPGEPSSNPQDLSRAALRPFSEDSPLAGLPMQLDVTIPIPGFRVQDLLALETGAVLESRWPHPEDVPVWCGGVQLVWTEFEVVDQKLAVRVTRLV